MYIPKQIVVDENGAKNKPPENPHHAVILRGIKTINDARDAMSGLTMSMGSECGDIDLGHKIVKKYHFLLEKLKESFKPYQGNLETIEAIDSLDGVNKGIKELFDGFKGELKTITDFDIDQVVDLLNRLLLEKMLYENSQYMSGDETEAMLGVQSAENKSDIIKALDDLQSKIENSKCADLTEYPDLLRVILNKWAELKEIRNKSEVVKRLKELTVESLGFDIYAKAD